MTFFLQYGERPEESLKIAGKRDVLRVSSWCELIQVLFPRSLENAFFFAYLLPNFPCQQMNFLKRFLGRGFLKHVQVQSAEIFYCLQYT
jgi:hypothetical protein